MPRHPSGKPDYRGAKAITEDGPVPEHPATEHPATAEETERFLTGS